MSLVEWVATALGVLCVALGVARSVWTFPTAIGSVVLVGTVAYRAHLYSDAVLQAFFVGANLYGWVNWRRSQAASGQVAVVTMAARERWGWALVFLVVTPLWSGAMLRLTDASYPWWDGAIAVASVIAQVLMGRRRLENWPLWVAIDVASIPLYLAKGLTVLALLYLLYLGMAVWGWVDWRRAARRLGPVPA